MSELLRGNKLLKTIGATTLSASMLLGASGEVAAEHSEEDTTHDQTSELTYETLTPAEQIELLQGESNNFISFQDKQFVKSLVRDHFDLAEDPKFVKEMFEDVDENVHAHFQIYKDSQEDIDQTGQGRFMYYYYPNGIESGEKAKIVHAYLIDFGFSIDEEIYQAEAHNIFYRLEDELTDKEHLNPSQARKLIIDHYELPHELNNLHLDDLNFDEITFEKTIDENGIMWSAYNLVEENSNAVQNLEVGYSNDGSIFLNTTTFKPLSEVIDEYNNPKSPFSLEGIEERVEASIVFDSNLA